MTKPQRIDFHTHTYLSDGALGPSELLRRAAVTGLQAIAITDHADSGNMAYILDSLHRVQREQKTDFGIELVVGIELTHVGPQSIGRLARQAKDLGAEVVVVHGETPVEPVAPGTNAAAVAEPAVDILAHPGFLTLEEARQAARRGCYVEITTRHGHSLTNGHVAKVCQQAGAQMIVNTDTHEPSNIVTLEFAQMVARGAGLDENQVTTVTITHPQALLARILAARQP